MVGSFLVTTSQSVHKPSLKIIYEDLRTALKLKTDKLNEVDSGHDHFKGSIELKNM